MVVGTVAYGTADHEYSGEDLYGGDSSSAYIKQLSAAIKADSAVGQGVLPTGHDYSVARDIIIGPHGRLDQ